MCPAEPLVIDDDSEEAAMDIDGGGGAPAPRKLFGLTLVHNYVALGYPIGDEDFVRTWLVGEDGNGGKLAKLNRIADLVDNLSDAQIKLYLLTRSVVQHVPYLARLIPRTQLEPLLTAFDSRVRRSLANIAGRTGITDDAWRQAKLPYKFGGLQLQDPVITADAAYLGSLSSFGSLTLEILGLAQNQNDGINLLRLAPEAEAIVNSYNAASGMTYEARAFPTGRAQKDLAEPIHERESTSFINSLSEESRARVLSSSGLIANAIYFAVPNQYFGTKIPSHSFEKIVQFKLGNVHSESPTCSYCGHANDANGKHQTTCQQSGLFHQRHNNVVNAFSNILHTAGIVIEHEITGLIGGNNRRPGDIVVHNFTEPGAAPFDVTVVSPTCPTNIGRSRVQGELANWADDNKRTSYIGTKVNPLSFESHGQPSRGSRWFMHRLADRMTEMSADLRLDELAIMTQRLYIAQRISIALQIGNARMLQLCGSHHAARQADRHQPDELAPMVDLRNVERRAILSA